MMAKYSFLITFVICYTACNSTLGTYQKYVDIPQATWESQLAPRLEFDIQDSSAYYHLFFYIRHYQNYHYNNIWLHMRMTNDADTLTYRKEFQLSNAKGWYGQSVTGNIIEQYIPITAIPTKLAYGKNSIQIEHLMREEPLENILTVGIKLKKIDH